MARDEAYRQAEKKIEEAQRGFYRLLFLRNPISLQILEQEII